ncbi:hypothetical protein COOONC_20149 [Cooperia oncophora]
MHNAQLGRNPFYDTNNVAPQKQSNDVFSGMNLSMQAFNATPTPIKEEQLNQFNMSSCFNYSGLKLPACHPGTFSQPGEFIFQSKFLNRFLIRHQCFRIASFIVRIEYRHT